MYNIWADILQYLTIVLLVIADILNARDVRDTNYRLQQTIETTSQALDNIGQMFVVIHERLKTLETEAEEE